MIKITDGKGFQMTFENGWTASVQFGRGNYCDHHHADYSIPQAELGDKGSITAEIAAWDKDDNWMRFTSDNVKGWVSADDVAKFLARVARKKA